MSSDRHWIVSWEIDAFQPTAHEAAQHVRDTILPADSTATVFIVTDPLTGHRWQMDLGEGVEQLLSSHHIDQDPGHVTVTRVEGHTPCRRSGCGHDAVFCIIALRGTTSACHEHLAAMTGDLLPQPQEITVTKYDGPALCVVADGHENTHAEYQAGKWLVCYRHLARGVAASVRGHGRP